MPKNNNLTHGLISILCIILVSSIVFCIYNKNQTDSFGAPLNEPRMFADLFDDLDNVMTDDYRKKRLPSNLPNNTRMGCRQFNNIYGNKYGKRQKLIDSFNGNGNNNNKPVDNQIVFSKNPDGSYNRILNTKPPPPSSNQLSQDDQEYYNLLCNEDHESKYGNLEGTQTENEIIQKYMKQIETIKSINNTQFDAYFRENLSSILGEDVVSEYMETLTEMNEEEKRQLFIKLLKDEIKETTFSSINNQGINQFDNYASF